MTLKRWRYTPNGRRISLLFGKRRMRIRTYGVVRGMVETPPYSIVMRLVEYVFYTSFIVKISFSVFIRKSLLPHCQLQLQSSKVQL